MIAQSGTCYFRRGKWRALSQELILEQTMLYVFCLFLSPLWSDVFVFLKKCFLQKLQQNLQNFDFSSSNLFKKSGKKNFFSHFSRRDSI